ncbi:MAG TPA: S-layer homology domain-containing protein [Thermoanaerobaculia bacterium]|nr:S-layer homology domain-containing protein [Thermoanaerobaculia bacterium]
MNGTFRVGLCLAFALTGAALRGQELAKKASDVRPKTYGVAQLSYYRMSAAEFTLLDTANGPAYSDVGYSNFGVFQRYSSGGPAIFVASPHLPSGALVSYYELDSCGEDPVEDVFANFFFCDNQGTGCGNGGISSNDNGTHPCGFAAFTLPEGFLVDNYRNQISVTVRTGSGTSSTRFAGVVLGYTLSVSPAPQFSDFGDVSTTDPGFQYIEALAASGVTVGCGNGNYCPDAPLTRRQMAVILAKALGLQWQ